MSQIQINPNGVKMWRMDEGQYCFIAVQTNHNGVMDGINLKGSNGNGKSSDVWLDVNEMRSLRDWINSLPLDSAS